ncbi:extracellular solute-binding protein [Paenibacillus aurantius]|uniref:Extracellular solute-binding protein n=1 Tax=Paenibacillus aurantius TaxID=2918900 RepID=A0AA96RHB4_9BACL|nr:extracellular solute-binding protein [Paenibacillus aurantius]WNQ13183.1 extracellular solute-binding protein [Paenibacillus aurantius]
MKRENEFVYLKFYNNLKEQILSGLIEPGSFLMSESDLCRHYELSRNSVRKALEQLVNDNLVIKKNGQGTIVNPELVIDRSPSQTLHIFAPTPATFVDTILPSLIQEYKVRYPNVEVKVYSLPYNVSFLQSIKKYMEMGIIPDLILLSDMHFPEISNNSAYEDLDLTLSSSLERLYPKLVDRFTVDGHIKAAPIMFTTVHLVYNRPLFERSGVPLPGKDWSLEVFLDAAQRLTLADDKGIIRQYGFAIMPKTLRWPVVALQNGLKQVRNEEELSRTISSSLEFLQDLIHRKRWGLLYRLAHERNPFFYGKAAMVLATGYEVSHWTQDKMAFDIGYAPLPFGPINATILRSNGFMIPEAARKKELARSFILTALSPAVQAKIAEGTPYLSVIRPVNEAIHSSDYLSQVNALEHQMEENYFETELFSDLHQAFDLDADMDLFWLGLEEPAELDSLFRQIYREGKS